MAFWLFKSEPFKWSWDHQKAKGELGEEWDGIRNYQARNNMRAMKLGDKGFFYHSNEGLEVVGIVEVCKEVHPDSDTGHAQGCESQSRLEQHGAGDIHAPVSPAGNRG